MKYFGTYDRSLDEKGRLQIPPKLLEREGENAFYLLKGFEGCISIFDQKGFDRYLQKLEELDFFDEETRGFIRQTAASIVPLKFDSHGRIQIGKAILDAYGIGRNVTVIGCLDHFEIWDPTAYASYALRTSLGFDHVRPKAKYNG